MTVFMCILLIAMPAAAVTIMIGILCSPLRTAHNAAVGLVQTLGFGFVLYYAVLAAILRHIWLSYNQFFCINGVGHPGHMLVMCLCLLLSFALFCTKYGDAFFAALHRASRYEIWRVIISLAATALLFIWCSRISIIKFHTNDDPQIMKQIAAINTDGISAAAGSFSNIVFCIFLSFFYRIAPNGYWYAWYHLAAMFTALAIVCRCIMLKMGHRRAGMAVIVYLFLGIGTCFSPIVSLAFTMTPAVVGSGAIALMLTRCDTPRRPVRIISDMLSLILILLSYTQREESGLVVLCFWGVAVAYSMVRTLLSKPNDMKLRLTAMILCAVLTLGGVFACEKVDDSLAPAAEYTTAEHYRSLIMDYLLQDLSADQLSRAGLSTELGNLLREWFFMDKSITTDTFYKLSKIYYADQQGITLDYRETDDDDQAAVNGALLAVTDADAQENDAVSASVQDTDTASVSVQNTDTASVSVQNASAAETDTDTAEEKAAVSPVHRILSAISGITNGASNRQAYVALLISLLLINLVSLIRYGRYALLEFFCALAAFGGAFILAVYLVMQGRFPTRVFMLVYIPPTIMNALMAMSLDKDAPVVALPRRVIYQLLMGFLLLICVWRCIDSIQYLSYTTYYADSRTVFKDQHDIETFVTQNPDTTYITCIPNTNFDPFHTASYPDNYSLWGGTGVTASEDRLYADAFFRDDVRFVYDSNSYRVYMISLMQYLTAEYGPVRLIGEQRLGSFVYVCRIEQVQPPEENFTGWYSSDGLIYYFDNGQAVSGTQVIDGVTYEFYGTGASVGLVSLSEDEDIMPSYTTLACSLIGAVG